MYADLDKRRAAARRRYAAASLYPVVKMARRKRWRGWRADNVEKARDAVRRCRVITSQDI